MSKVFQVVGVQRKMKENKNHLKLIYEMAEEILGLDFDGFYAYFSEILEGGFSYIILMSRRCQVLFHLFKYIFEYDGKPVKNKAVFLSDKALTFYWDKFRDGDRIAVLDDIIVHGRTISQFYAMFEELDKNVEVKLFSYAADKNMDCITEEAEKVLHVSYRTSTNEWRELSGKIVDCIQMSNIPYTSFVTSFFQYGMSSPLETIKKIDSLEIIENADLIQQGQRQHSYVVYDRNWERPDIFSSISLGECIRIYWNELTGKLTVIPYVFIRSMPEEKALEVYKAAEEALSERFKNTKEVFKKEFTAEKLQRASKEYKMRALTCLLSNYYWDVFRNKYQLPEPEFADIDTLKESFGKAVGEELCAACEDTIGELSDLSFHIESEVFEEISEAEMILEEVIRRGKDNWIKRFFFQAWLNDENRAEKKRKRALGISADYILKTAQKLGEKYYEVLARLINSWDLGTSTANFAMDNERHAMICCNTPGEQSYRILLENNPCIMRSLIVLSNLVTKGDAGCKEKTFEAYREEVLLELLEKFHKSGYQGDYREIEQIIRKSKGYMGAWDQPQVLNCYMPNHADESDIYEEFIKEKF